MTRPATVAAAVVLAALVAYYVFFRSLPNLPTGWDVAFVSVVLIPAVFALAWFALPFRRSRGLFMVGAAFAMLALVASLGGLEVLANFAKLGAAIAIAFWFLSYFESVLWVALVALMIPIVDSYSVWRGPTEYIISERPEVFSALSFAFPLAGERQAIVRWEAPRGELPLGYDVFRRPGSFRSLNRELIEDTDGNGRAAYLEAELGAERDYAYRIVAVYPQRRFSSPWVEAPADRTNDGFGPPVSSTSPRGPQDVEVDSADSAAKLGIPDLLFFALFLAAADRFGLRRRLTWLLMAASFGTTLALTYVFEIDGLPALPLLALAFLIANPDRLWRAFRERKR